MEALYNRGNTKLVLNDNAGAIADFDRVIALAPNFDEAYNNRGSAKSMFGDKKGPCWIIINRLFTAVTNIRSLFQK